MKILLIGDSYGLPRFCKGQDKVALTYEQSYPEQLRRYLYADNWGDIVFVNHCRHANTTRCLVNGEANEFAFLEPDFVIIQLGLPDLWPPPPRKFKIVSADDEIKKPQIPLDEFKNNLLEFVYCAKSYKSTVILVGVPNITNDVAAKFPGVDKRIELYNRALQEVAAETKVVLVDLYRMIDWLTPEKFIGDDGIHPTVQGAACLAKAIFRAMLGQERM